MTSIPASAGAATPTRPRTVDWALYAIVARCVLLLISALLEYPYYQHVLDRTRQLNPKATAAQIKVAVPTGNVAVLQAIIGIVLVLLVAKFVRDGKNWARILFAVLVVLLFRDVFGLSALANKADPWPLRISIALTASAAIVAVSLLFVRPSAPFFRRPGVQANPSPFGGLFRPRPTTATTGDRGGAPAASKAGRAPGKSRGNDPSPAASGVGRSAARPAGQSARPRGKSRKAGEV